MVRSEEFAVVSPFSKGEIYLGKHGPGYTAGYVRCQGTVSLGGVVGQDIFLSVGWPV